MSEQNIGFDITLPVGAGALTAYQLVKTPAGVVQSAANTDDCIGVIQNGAAANDATCTVRIFGVTRVQVTAAVAVGASLMPGAAGQVTTHDGTSTKPIIGIALEAATAANDEILAFIGCAHMLAGPAA